MTEPPGPQARSFSVIPLVLAPTPPGRREVMRSAVVEVINVLVVASVPPSRRSPYFERAQGLLEDAGWGLEELLEAADPGARQEELFLALRLGEEEPG